MSKTETLLERAINMKIGLMSDTSRPKLSSDPAENRYNALQDISLSIDQMGMFNFCKMFRLLVDNCAEEFAIEFMTAYNDEIGHKY